MYYMQRYTSTVIARVTPEIKTMLKKIVQNRGITISQWLRMKVLDELRDNI